jgi:hypothetical protein
MLQGYVVPVRPPEDKLSEKRYLSVSLRLLLDRRGRLIQGEVVDLQGQAQRRFVGWRGLVRGLRAWLAEQPQRDARSAPNIGAEDGTQQQK